MEEKINETKMVITVTANNAIYNCIPKTEKNRLSLLACLECSIPSLDDFKTFIQNKYGNRVIDIIAFPVNAARWYKINNCHVYTDDAGNVLMGECNSVHIYNSIFGKQYDSSLRVCGSTVEGENLCKELKIDNPFTYVYKPGTFAVHRAMNVKADNYRFNMFDNAIVGYSAATNSIVSENVNIIPAFTKMIENLSGMEYGTVVPSRIMNVVYEQYDLTKISHVYEEWAEYTGATTKRNNKVNELLNGYLKNHPEYNINGNWNPKSIKENVNENTKNDSSDDSGNKDRDN